MEGFIKVNFLYWHEGVNAERIESMWTTQVGDNYKIDNIPFYVQEYALGDIVSVKEENGQLYVDELVEESGHSTIQMVFFDENIIQATREQLKEMGCPSEISDKPFLIGIDVPPNVSYQKIVKPYLDEGFNKGLWDCAEACLATEQQNT